MRLRVSLWMWEAALWKMMFKRGTNHAKTYSMCVRACVCPPYGACALYICSPRIQTSKQSRDIFSQPGFFICVRRYKVKLVCILAYVFACSAVYLCNSTSFICWSFDWARVFQNMCACVCVCAGMLVYVCEQRYTFACTRTGMNHKCSHGIIDDVSMYTPRWYQHIN